MSFSSDVRAELCDKTVRAACCRRDLLFGLLYDCVLNEEEKCIVYETSDENVLGTVIGLFGAVYKYAPTQSVDVKRGKKIYRLSADLPKFVAAFTDARKSDDPLPAKRCDGCAVCFLRGVFLSSGTVSDPSHGYHAEILLSDPHAAYVTLNLLGDNFSPPKTITRKNGTGLYYKSGEKIGEFLGFLGADKSMFGFINAKIKRDFKNNANRSANCETVNIEKSVNAAQTQISAINRLIALGRFDALPEELRTTALLRLENDECSLAELAALHEPKITKSGLNHRLRKIAEEAEAAEKSTVNFKKKQ